MGLVTLFLSLFVTALLLSLIRSRPNEVIKRQIINAEGLSRQINRLDTYYELKDNMRKKISAIYNLLCKNEGLTLINFESDYRTLEFAIKKKDLVTLKALRLSVDGNKFYYRDKNNDYLLIMDTAKLKYD